MLTNQILKPIQTLTLANERNEEFSLLALEMLTMVTKIKMQLTSAYRNASSSR
jgi:hypothetical protein